MLIAATMGVPAASAEETHSQPPPEKLGSVTFAISCAPGISHEFERAVALLHSFAYTASEKAFRDVVAADPSCAMAHWAWRCPIFTSCGARPARSN